MLKRLIPITLLAAALGGGLAGCHGYQGDVRVHDRDYDAHVVFSDRDRAIIRDYYRVHHRGLPPGLAKQGKIPPGHAYKLQRQRSIPHDVRWERLPGDVERRLSRLPAGYARIAVGADVAIMNTRTRVVVDLLENFRY